MLKLLRSLFVPSEIPTPGRPSFDAAFFRFFSVADRFKAGLALDATQEQVVAFTREAAEDLAKSTGAKPWGYSENGRSVLPLFSSESTAEAFAGDYADRVQRIIPFQLLEVEGRALLPSLAEFNDVVLDPRTAGEVRILSRSDEHGA